MPDFVDYLLILALVLLCVLVNALGNPITTHLP